VQTLIVIKDLIKASTKLLLLFYYFKLNENKNGQLKCVYLLLPITIMISWFESERSCAGKSNVKNEDEMAEFLM
jgi:hypothetical protein